MHYLIISSYHRGKIDLFQYSMYRNKNVVLLYTDEISGEDDSVLDLVYLGV